MKIDIVFANSVGRVYREQFRAQEGTMRHSAPKLKKRVKTDREDKVNKTKN